MEMKHVVAHELIHVQQTQMAGDTTLLSYVIVEEMAYFEQASDKKKAVFNMLSIKDYRKFLTESKIEEKMAAY